MWDMEVLISLKLSDECTNLFKHIKVKRSVLRDIYNEGFQFSSETRD